LKDGVHPLLKEFEIEFTKLKEGIHEFQYRIGKSFFEAFENTEVFNAHIQVQAVLEKQNQMMQINLKMNGIVSLTCDRCLESLNMPVDTTYLLIYKVRDIEATEPEVDFELIYITPNEIAVNVSQSIYETVLLALPMIRNCDLLESKPCNQTMLQKLEYLKHQGEGESDPRWDKLKEMLK
jgi:uncharacterized metal-binding protein YceD (DUF177 family)